MSLNTRYMKGDTFVRKCLLSAFWHSKENCGLECVFFLSSGGAILLTWWAWPYTLRLGRLYYISKCSSTSMLLSETQKNSARLPSFYWDTLTVSDHHPKSSKSYFQITDPARAWNSALAWEQTQRDISYIPWGRENVLGRPSRKCIHRSL